MTQNETEAIKNATAFITTDTGRGTGYLIAPDIIITCAHVIQYKSNGEQVNVRIGTYEGSAQVEEVDAEADCAVLRLPRSVDTTPLPLAARDFNRRETWDAYGYPAITNESGHWLTGDVQDASGRAPDGSISLVLYSREIAAASGALPQGFSGSPVLINGQVVGHLKEIVPDPDDFTKPRAELGTLYACPAGAIRKLLPADITLPEPANNLVEEAGRSVSGNIPQHFLTILDSTFGEYASLLSKDIKNKLDHIHKKYRQGKVEDARNDSRALKNNTEMWQKLEASAKAEVLRQLARYELDLGTNPNEIRSLIIEAKTLDPSIDDTIVRVMLRNKEQGVEAGLSELGEPKTVSAYNLRLSLLFQANQYDDILSALQDPPVGISPDTESERFHALALLAKGALPEARAMMKGVLSEQGDWELVQVAAAMIDYWSGMAIGMTTPRVVAIPAPVRLELAKSDPESLQYFRKAEQRFASLIESTQRGDEQKKYYEVWRLASLANDISRQQEAVDYSSELLTRDPTHHYVLLWMMNRDYPFDEAASESALEMKLNKALGTDEQMVCEIVPVLCALYLRSRQSEKAQTLLEKTKEHLISENGSDIWAFWQIQRLLIESEIDEAQSIAAQAESVLIQRRFEMMILRARAIKTQDFSEVARQLGTSFQETHDPDFLLEFCELSFDLRNWEAIVKYAQQLNEAIGNPHTVNLTTLACWNSGRHVSALSILENHQKLFLDKRLPDHLWRLKIMSLLHGGKISEANAEMNSIAQAAPTTDNLRTCVDACVQMGDLPELSGIARKLIGHEDVPFETMAKMASLLSVCDPELAKQYLLRARDGLLEHPEFAAFLFNTSSRLDLEGEIGQLFRQIIDSYPTDVTNVWMIPLKEFPGQQQRMQEHQERIMEQYGKGAVPLHLVVSKGNSSLVEWLHSIPEWNRSHFAPRSRRAIYTRHGGHLVKDHLVATSTHWRIHADITSLLLAESLDLLDKVEGTLGTIIISSSVQPSLIWQMNHLSPQASRVKVCQNILRMRDEEKFHLASLSAEEMATNETVSPISNRLFAFMQKAQQEGGYVVTYLPLITLEGEPITIPPELADRVINCRAVLESLIKQGWLTQLEYEEACHGLGTEGRKEPLGTVPMTRTKLFLDGNIAETLEGAGLLSEVCECFDVWIDEQQIEWARQQKWSNDNIEELQKWLRRLIDRLRTGLENGKYRTISLPDVLPDEIREDPEPDTLEMQCIRDLLLFEPQEGDVVWIDDRCFNRHDHTERGVPIITICEILSALQSQKKLSESKYYEKVLALRTGNFRYIPLNQFEILHHLKGASFKPGADTNENNSFVETKNLKKLRRSIAASLLDQGRLQPDGEGWFLHSVIHTVKAAILLLWKDENISIEQAHAYSDWIFENLFVSPLGFAHLYDPSILRPSLADAMGAELGDYLTGGFVLSRDSQKNELRQQAYFKWLNNRLLFPCFNADSQTVSATASKFRDVFGNISFPERSQEYLEVLVYKIFLELRLPEDIAEALANELAPNAEAFKKVGLPPHGIIRLGPLGFHAETLIKAFEKAWRKGSATIKAIGEKKSCRIVKGSSSEICEEGFYIEDPLKKLRLSISDEIWKLLSGDISVREEILKRNRDWFDSDQQTFEKEIKRIAAFESFTQRFESLEKIRQQSAAVYYQSLPQVLQEESSVSWLEMMPPSIEGLLRHFRLTSSGQENRSIAERLAYSVAILFQEEGLSETVDRFACLPVRMPDLLVNEIVRLSREERVELLRFFAGRWASPISNLHLLDLVLRSGDGKEDFLDIAQSALDWLFTEKVSEQRFSHFCETLRLVSIGFGRLGDAKRLDIGTKLLLLWAHTARLHNIFGQIGKGITFSWADEWSKWETIFTDNAYLNDVLHPQRISRPVFLMHGLLAIFANQSKGLVDSLNIAEFLASIAFVKQGENQVPAVQLLFDPTLVLNQTGSFLGGDKTDTIRALLGDDVASLLSSTTLRQWIAIAVEQLKTNPHQLDEWLKILFVTGDLTMPTELAQSFREMVEELDLLGLYRNNPKAATIAIRVIAAQLADSPDEKLRQRFEHDVLQIALQGSGKIDGTEEKGQATIQRRNIGAVILEVAVQMVFRDQVKPGEPKGNEGLLLRLIEYVAQFRDLVSTTGLMQIIHEIPPDKAWKLWPVILAVRAAS